jgi:DeoR/GlpR family transcriptional regulator of sugar metabolism
MSIPRHREIIGLLHARGECTVEDLAHSFGVSPMTIRRDLNVLAESGQVIRTHGGAAPAEAVMFEFQFLRRAKLNATAKDRIGAAAASLVRDGQSVLLDSGTTTLCIARHLRERNGITVITTSLPIASVLQRAAGVQTLLLGGYVRREAPDLQGPLTESNLESLRADIAFIGADGIDENGTCYNASLTVARMLSKMIHAAQQVYIVADASKLGRTALASFGHLADFSGLITDATAPTPVRDTRINTITADAAKETVHG